MIAIERDYQAYLDEMQVITIIIPHALHQDDERTFTLECDGDEFSLTVVDKIHFNEFMKYICHLQDKLHLGSQYWVKDQFERKTDLQMGAVTRTSEFDEVFNYEGSLGAFYQQAKTSFKLWAPTATGVKLKLITSDGLKQELIDLTREDKGVWMVSVQENLEHYLYTFLVCVNLQWKEAVDPYAVAVTANGMEGVIIDLNKTKRQKRVLPPLEHVVDSVIYETHIRDLTMHPNSGVKQKGLYLGAAEMDTKSSKNGSTALSYIKELGVTHIEFLPLNDFAGVDELGQKKEYNWGYNPLHYNVPDGSYSTNPHNPYSRINELKTLIDTIHQNGLRVILDVVYNHVYKRETSSFEKIVPGYYFRHDEHGMPSNGTGVGNDIASERKMVRKFILDSVLFWLNEYHVDGFRFDLMGIHDIDTMRAIRVAVDRINPSVIIIGEGWELNTPLTLEKKAIIHNQSRLSRIGQFNDWFRDSIKGSTFNLYDLGYALGNEHYYDMAMQVLAGSIGVENKEGLFSEPEQSVNYVESHDNHTLWDKLMVCFQNEEQSTIRKYHRLATVMVLLAQGIPFIHSGQEFFRTKQGEGNSYKSSDEINQLDWDRMDEVKHHFEYIKGIISIRKSHRAFRLPAANLIRNHLHFLPLKKPLIGFTLLDVERYGPSQSVIVFFNPTKIEETVSLPEGNWKIMADSDNSGTHSVDCVNKQLCLKPISSYVLYKD